MSDPRYIQDITMRPHRVRAALLAAFLATAVLSTALPAAAQTSSRRAGRPARDTPAQPAQAQALGSGRIAGRVVTTDTGRPVRRARVVLSAPGLPTGRATVTTNDGIFEFTGLPTGRYTLAASKSGFVTLAYGQRRPLQPGTPLDLQDGQELTGVEFRLPRGSVIAGRVYDDAGDPLPGAFVRVLAYRYVQGSRQLLPAGAAQTDDRGEYRVWGLNPGDYYVTAIGRNAPAFGPGGRGGPIGPGAPPGANVGGVAPETDDNAGYAPTYYPGVESVAQARPITVALGAEALDIDFGVLLVRTARVSGRVTTPSGAAVTFGNVVLAPEGQQAGRGGPGAGFGARVGADGAFGIANVPPGRYVLRARGEENDVPYFAMMPISVSGQDVAGVSVVLAPGATVSGRVRLEATTSVTASLSQFRIGAPSADPGGTVPGPQPLASIDADGRFTIQGLPAGPHWIRARMPVGWLLKTVTADGRDVTDVPLDLRSGQQLSNVTVVFTDRGSEINGVITDDQRTPLTQYTLLAFPPDPSLWHPQSRQIMTARPDQNGKFQMRGLPPGEYLLAAVDPTEAGEWFEPAYLEEHRSAAVRLQLGEGDIKTQNVTIALR